MSVEFPARGGASCVGPFPLDVVLAVKALSLIWFLVDRTAFALLAGGDRKRELIVNVEGSKKIPNARSLSLCLVDVCWTHRGMTTVPFCFWLPASHDPFIFRRMFALHFRWSSCYGVQWFGVLVSGSWFCSGENFIERRVLVKYRKSDGWIESFNADDESFFLEGLLFFFFATLEGERVRRERCPAKNL